ncbi:NUDIX domain-containing protein [Amycolatopsis sp. cg5]|uniref:NUDIX domain-containing protein n=1 Tax=Amycolatopsis sp. cg5 TaxID=3238802 RepID=UPI003525ABE4
MRSLPRKRMSAGMLLLDERQRILLIEPSYKKHFDIPGGVVEADEPPWRTSERELYEELGISRRGPAILVDYMTTTDQMPEGIAWIFDGGRIDQAEVDRLVLTDPEVNSVGLYTLAEMERRVVPHLARRLAAAVEVAGTGQLALCEDGRRLAR